MFNSKRLALSLICATAICGCGTRSPKPAPVQQCPTLPPVPASVMTLAPQQSFHERLKSEFYELVPTPMMSQ